MEPDLQAINNPYIAAARARTVASTIPISRSPMYSFGGATQGGPPPVSNTTPGTLNSQSSASMSNIDPALRGSATERAGAPMSHSQRNSSQRFEGGPFSESESSSEDNSHAGSNSSDDDGNDMPDVGWAATGQARQAHPGMYLSELECRLTPS